MSVIASVAEYAMAIARAGTTAALALAIGTAENASNRVGTYADLTASAEKLGLVVGGVTGPTFNRESSQVVAVNLVVDDASFVIADNGDRTRTINFQAGSITAGFGLTIDAGAQTANRTLSVPALGGNRTLALIDQAQTFTAAQTMSSTLTLDTSSNGLTISKTTGTTLTVSSTTDSVNKDTGSIVTEGGLGVEKTIVAGTGIRSELGTLAASTLAYYSSVTWNNAGVTFDSLRFDVTDTASGASSRLFAFLVGGATRLNFLKNGTMNLVGASSNAGEINIVGNGAGTGTGLTLQQDSAQDAFIYQRSNRPLYFGTNNQTRGAISAAGDWSIGAASGTGKLDIVHGTITSASPTLSSSVTWNAGAVSFTGWKLDVTNTASLSSSKYLSVTEGGADRFYVDTSVIRMNARTGSNAGFEVNAPTSQAPYFRWLVNGSNVFQMVSGSTGNLTVGDLVNSTSPLTYTPGAIGAGFWTFANTTDSTTTGTGALVCSGGGGFAKQVSAQNYLATMGMITAAEPVIDSTVTWNSGGVTFTGLRLNVTDTASASASLLLDLQVGGSTRHSIRKDGQTIHTGVTGTTAATDAILIVGNNSTGTPAAGYGSRTIWQLKSSTTNGQDAAQLETSWVVATHASRTARAVWTVYDTAARECLRMEASGTAAMIGFLGASAVARATMAAATGTATRTTFDTTTVTTQQLAERVKALIDDSRAYGLHG